MSPVLRSDSGPACLATFCASPTAFVQLSFEAADSSQVTLSLRRADIAAQVDVARMATPGMTSVGLPVPATMKALVTPGSFLISSRFASPTLPPTAGHFSNTAYCMPGTTWSMPNSGCPVTTRRLSTPVTRLPSSL